MFARRPRRRFLLRLVASARDAAASAEAVESARTPVGPENVEELGYFADPDGHLWEVAFNPALLRRIEERLDCEGGIPERDSGSRAG